MFFVNCGHVSNIRRFIFATQVPTTTNFRSYTCFQHDINMLTTRERVDTFHTSKERFNTEDAHYKESPVHEVMFSVPTEFCIVKVKVTKEGVDRTERLLTTGEHGACLGCEVVFTADDVKRCGMCHTCYNGALYAITKKRTTRAALIKAGKMLPPSPGGRKPANAFTRSLTEE
jgi:hypothetical protein